MQSCNRAAIRSFGCSTLAWCRRAIVQVGQAVAKEAILNSARIEIYRIVMAAFVGNMPLPGIDA